MRFFGGPADGKDLRVPGEPLTFRVEINDGYGDSIEYFLYRRYRHLRTDGTTVDVMVDRAALDSLVARIDAVMK